MPNEADTCRRYVVPQLQAAGWDNEPHRINEQVTFTDGRIVVAGRQGRRRPGKRADYILRFRPDFPIAVVEAKPPMLVSHDGGTTWRESGRGLPAGFAVAIAEDDPDLVVYAARNRLYVSRDGARFWTGLAVELPEIEAVELRGL